MLNFRDRSLRIISTVLERLFYGDGYSKSFDKVKTMYDGVVVEKQECVGHIQKRVGNQLRKLKREVKGLCGTNRLTGEMTDKLQNYDDGVVVEKQECVGHIQKRVGNQLKREVKGLCGTNRLTGEMTDKLQNYDDGVVVEKQECVGHIQKRVGNQLRKLKREVKGLGGTNRLTGEMTDKLQNYFGIAIRSNVGNLEGMKSAVAATLFHVASNERNPWHVHCPVGKGSWCGFQRDIANETSTYKHGAGLPMDVINRLNPFLRTYE